MASTGDPWLVMRERLLNVAPSLAWTPDDPTWAMEARNAIVSAIGVVDKPPPSPSLDILSEAGEDGFTRRRVQFPSHQGWRGRGWLLIPEGLSRGAPAVVCVHGHGKGADAIVGLVEEPYQDNFALHCVREGWVVLAVEQVSFGSNRSTCVGEDESSCVRDSMAALLLGETITGWRVRDAQSALWALRTLAEVDADRIGVMGISGGGLTALWAAAVETGFLVAGVSGYFCPIAHSIMSVYHCPDNYVPGFGRLMDVPDLAGLVAPRWLAVENGTDDPLFAALGFERACQKARVIYDQERVPERFASELFQGDHHFHGVGMLAHFRRAFQAQDLQSEYERLKPGTSSLPPTPDR